MRQSSSSGKLRLNKQKRLLHKILINTDLYLLILPALAILFIFRYLPIYGIQIAFKDFNIRLGIEASPWVGLKHFKHLFNSPDFFRIFRNTLLFNLYRLIFQFPIPIIMALAIYEVKNRTFKRSVQTLSYLPHFLSWVVIGAIFMNLLSTQGMVNSVLGLVGRDPVVWLAEARYFRSMLVISDAWKNSGWGSIVYLSAIMSIDTDLFEAARADGAGVFRRMWHITLPSIRPTIFFIIMLRLSAMLGSDVEQILVLYSPVVYDVGDVISSYVYRVGLTNMKYSYSSAVGLFSSVIGFILLVSANYTSRAFGERTLW
ncbi:MAG: ABC transporter permease subunit [Bacillota bacterium]|nr:ABC transporter permease subunit [Bacillota bacterium]